MVYGSVPIVAGTVPLAVGAAMANKINKTEGVAVAYIGDGAVEEGVVHESMNLAKILKVPVIFVVENNLFASHMNIKLRQPNPNTIRFAQANEIKNFIVDGNNVIEVYKSFKSLIDFSKKNMEPGFLEAFTYRWYGHVDWREDTDVGLNRSSHEIKSWKKSDPVERFEKCLFKLNAINQKLKEKISFELDTCIEESWSKAMKDPYPEEKSIKDYVYKNG